MARPQAALAISESSAKAPEKTGALWVGVLRELPLFSGVSARHIRKVSALTRGARFSRGATIVKAGETGDDFYVILEGSASIVRRGGLPPITIGPGACFGEMSLLDGGERSATVMAETDVVCLRLSRGPFLKIVKGEPEIALALLRELSRRIRELQAQAHLTA
jgi:CRP-like cAMP-binding protein